MTLSLALVAAAVGTWVWNRYANVERVDVDLAAVSKEGPSNYLVVGSDTRTGIEADAAGSGAFLDGAEGEAGHRSDTLMVVRVDPSKQRASLLSVPRDLWVQIDGEGHRINAAYNDGPQAVIDAVQENLQAEAEIVRALRDEYVASYGVLRAMGLLTVEHLALGIESYNPDVYFSKVESGPSGGYDTSAVDRIRKRWEQ